MVAWRYLANASFKTLDSTKISAGIKMSLSLSLCQYWSSVSYLPSLGGFCHPSEIGSRLRVSLNSCWCYLLNCEGLSRELWESRCDRTQRNPANRLVGQGLLSRSPFCFMLRHFWWWRTKLTKDGGQASGGERRSGGVTGGVTGGSEQTGGCMMEIFRQSLKHPCVLNYSLTPPLLVEE